MFQVNHTYSQLINRYINRLLETRCLNDNAVFYSIQQFIHTIQKYDLLRNHSKLSFSRNLSYVYLTCTFSDAEKEKLKNEMRIMIEEGPDSTIYGYQSFIRQSKEFDYVFHFVKYFNILVSTLPKHYQPDWFVCFIFSNTLSNSLETMNGKRRIVFTPNLSQTFELSINSISTP